MILGVIALDPVAAVSYTHLDVYKRQVLIRSRAFVAGIGALMDVVMRAPRAPLQ